MTRPRPPSARTVVRRLEKAYGKRPWRARGAARPPANRDRPLDSLIGTILSQNTNAGNAQSGMTRLRAAYPDWDDAADAPVARLAAAIRPAGLHRQKAKNIKAILRTIRKERRRPGRTPGPRDRSARTRTGRAGRLKTGLDFLRHWPTDRARVYLAGLPGVGPKTAACVLLFSLGRPVLPVDTHVHRVSRRLGLIGPTTTPEKAHQTLAEKVPSDLIYPFHVLLIEHGRRTCRARRPVCAECVLGDLCPSAFERADAERKKNSSCRVEQSGREAKRAGPSAKQTGMKIRTSSVHRSPRKACPFAG